MNENSFGSENLQTVVSLGGVQQARRHVYRHLQPTPLLQYPLLSEAFGCRLHIKHENHNPTGSFKIRGGLTLLANLSRDDKRRGVITATRGNHGQSIALASRIHDVRCRIAVPEGNNPEKNRAMQAYGAELIIHGRDFDEAREKVEQICRSESLRYIHSANEPDLIHGVGTYALEILETVPDVDTIFVPIGGGSGISGMLTVVRQLAPGVKVIGVQAERASAVYQSWKKGSLQTTETADTFADGLATRVPFPLTFQIIRRDVDNILTVTEDEIRHAVYQLYTTTHNIAEGAGAAATAGAFKMRHTLKGQNVVVVLSGSNLEAQQLRSILRDYQDR